MSSNDIADWFRRIPTMSKYWFTGSIVMPLLGKLGVVSIMTMLLDYSLVVHKFQVQSALPLGHMVSGIPDLPSLRKKKVKLSFLYFTFVVFFFCISKLSKAVAAENTATPTDENMLKWLKMQAH